MLVTTILVRLEKSDCGTNMCRPSELFSKSWMVLFLVVISMFLMQSLGCCETYDQDTTEIGFVGKGLDVSDGGSINDYLYILNISTLKIHGVLIPDNANILKGEDEDGNLAVILKNGNGVYEFRNAFLVHHMQEDSTGSGWENLEVLDHKYMEIGFEGAISILGYCNNRYYYLRYSMNACNKLCIELDSSKITDSNDIIKYSEFDINNNWDCFMYSISPDGKVAWSNDMYVNVSDGTKTIRLKYGVGSCLPMSWINDDTLIYWSDMKTSYGFDDEQSATIELLEYNWTSNSCEAYIDETGNSIILGDSIVPLHSMIYSNRDSIIAFFYQQDIFGFGDYSCPKLLVLSMKDGTYYSIDVWEDPENEEKAYTDNNVELIYQDEYMHALIELDK